MAKPMPLLAPVTTATRACPDMLTADCEYPETNRRQLLYGLLNLVITGREITEVSNLSQRYLSDSHHLTVYHFKLIAF